MSTWIWIIILLVIFGSAYYGVRRRRLNRSR
jgi:hypothetical protein